MHILSNKKNQIALIGCGYWGTIIANNLLNLGHKNFYVYDSNIKNSHNLKKKFKNVIISRSYDDILKNESIKIFFMLLLHQKIFH